MSLILEVVNPATEDVIEKLECDSPISIREKHRLALNAKKEWAQYPLPYRIAALARFSELLRKNAEQLARILTSEVGKPLKQSLAEIEGARNRIAFFTQLSEKYLSTETVFESANQRVEKISYEPLGVVTAISAWNYPYLVAMNVLVPALIAGNSVLYKPSEFATLTGIQIVNFLRKAGVPHDALQCVVGKGGQGALLLDCETDGVFFTGSEPTGRAIHRQLAGRLIATGFELGGKDPVYICADVDLAKTASAVADGAFYNAGQSCCAVERIYVEDSIFKAFVEAFVEEVRRFKLGDPLETDTYLGPLTRNAQRQVLQAQVADAKAKGARVLLGGGPEQRRGYFFQPTVLVNVDHGMTVMREESFGPVIGIQSVESDAQALAQMNDTRYGLTAGVYSRDQQRALGILEKVNAGSAYWNCCDRVSPYLPWSGRQASGLGSTLSHLGIRTFAKPKAFHLIY